MYFVFGILCALFFLFARVFFSYNEFVLMYECLVFICMLCMYVLCMFMGAVGVCKLAAHCFNS